MAIETKLFSEISNAIEEVKKKLITERRWLQFFSSFAKSIEFLEKPWMDKKFINKIPTKIPSITKISGVDGGLISEALAGLDLILYRAVGVTFDGIGIKVDAHYTPSFDPEPSIYIGPSLKSRNEFLKLATLYRLLSEYSIATETIIKENPTVLFLDGKVTPLGSDFTELQNQSPNVSQIEVTVKEEYRKLVDTAYEFDVLLVGVVKDSRSRSLSQTLFNHIPDWIRTKIIQSSSVKGWRINLAQMLDQNLCGGILSEGERTSWLKGLAPSWLSPRNNFQIWSTLVRPIKEDLPIKIEVITHDKTSNKALEIALGSLSVLSKHGLPVAIPTIILEADNRVKLSGDHLENMINEISLAFGISKDELRKRRSLTSSLNR